MNIYAKYTLNRISFRFGIQLVKFISLVVMGILFFFVVTPIGVLTRFLGKDILKLQFNKNDKSYWIQKNIKKSKMKNQF